MQATMLPFPYTLSCQPYNDITESVTSSSRSRTPSPPAKIYDDRCYETLFPSRLHHEDSHPITGITFESSQTFTRKKSFTIEAILGLNNEDSGGRKDFGDAGWIDENPRERRTVSPQRTGVLAMSPLTGVFNSAADKKESKSRVHHVTNPSPREFERYRIPAKSTSPNSKSSNSGSSSKGLIQNGKMKRIRTIFTPEQLERLELEFERQQYMVGPERMYLASALGLSESQVKVWFQNRRIKFRKQHLEMQQARLAQLRETEAVESENEAERAHLTQGITSTRWDDTMDSKN